MLKIIKKRDLLNEALGVPDGLPETAKKIYFGILNSIPHSANFNRLNGLKLLISGNYIVGDYSFNKVNFDIRIVEDNDFNLLGMSTGTDMVLDKEVKNNIGSVGSVKNRYIHVSRDLRQRPQTPYGFDLSVDFSGPKSGPKMVRGEDILKYFIQNKNKMIKIIGHELMHLYDFYKNKKRNLNTQVKNILSQLDLSIDIPSLTTFKQMLYFVNSNLAFFFSLSPFRSQVTNKQQKTKTNRKKQRSSTRTSLLSSCSSTSGPQRLPQHCP
jgi:hypothetical protein